MAGVGVLPDSIFAFLRDLAANNDKGWFEANRERYERQLLDPVLDFIASMAGPLASVSPQLVVDSSPRGGSLFRIHRDVRFSADKSPYKTHAGVYFHHRQAGRKGVGPGLYLHLEPGNCLAALGVHSERPAEVAPIRAAIVERPDEWRAAKAVLDGTGWALGGESLRGAPRGFPADHPLIEDIRRKDFYAQRALSEEEVTRPGFGPALAREAACIAPLGAFLASALDLDW